MSLVADPLDSLQGQRVVLHLEIKLSLAEVRER
ncbi:hypothetical protein ES703_67025 [subsurface metagenome]